MKLFLSSMHPSNHEALLRLCSTRQSVVIVPTGWDTYPSDRRKTELGHILTTFKELGFTISLLDLTKATASTVRDSLQNKSLVWVMAGNTFYLNFYLQQSGFAKIVKEATAQGLVYGGESAGAVVAGSTLHGVEKVDDPAEAPAIIWEGLGLVDHGILPHADWEKYRKPMAEAKEEMEKFTQVTTINNNQALVIVDGQAEIVDNPAASE